MEKMDMTNETPQTRRQTDSSSESASRMHQAEMPMDSSDDVSYLLSQCEALVQDRDSWKERSFEAERIISDLKREKQELIRAIAGALNRS